MASPFPKWWTIRTWNLRAACAVGLKTLVDAGEGLHAAHTCRDARGRPLHIVHRDVCPGNVLVGLDGLGRVADFGIALAASRIASSRPGVLKGKPSYMSPEQARGEGCDARSDIFSLGILLWEVLTGQRLFVADMDVATLVKVMECNVPVPSSVNDTIPETLDQVAMRALALDPGARFSSAREFAMALEAAAKRHDHLASSTEVSDRLQRLFAVEIDTRQRVLREQLAASSGEILPARSRLMGLVPKISIPPASVPNPSGLPMSEPSSGVRPASKSVRAPTPPPVVSEAPASQAFIQAASEPPDTVVGRHNRTGLVLVAVASVGALGLWVAAGWGRARPRSLKTGASKPARIESVPPPKAIPDERPVPTTPTPPSALVATAAERSSASVKDDATPARSAPQVKVRTRRRLPPSPPVNGVPSPNHNLPRVGCGKPIPFLRGPTRTQRRR